MGALCSVLGSLLLLCTLSRGGLCLPPGPVASGLLLNVCLQLRRPHGVRTLRECPSASPTMPTGFSWGLTFNTSKVELIVLLPLHLPLPLKSFMVGHVIAILPKREN